MTTQAAGSKSNGLRPQEPARASSKAWVEHRETVWMVLVEGGTSDSQRLFRVRAECPEEAGSVALDNARRGCASDPSKGPWMVRSIRRSH